jgi:predicted porin
MDAGAMSGDGKCRDHDGVYVQGTYNYGGGKVGASWGGSYQDKAGNDGASKDPKESQEMYTVGIYHNLAPEWLAVAEYSHAEESWHNMDTGDEDGESDIFSVGMFYLW